MPKQPAVATLEWKGDIIKREMRRATARGIGFIRSAASRHAKKNHPGWKNISYRAQRSVRPQGKVHYDPEVKGLVGDWGSTLFYVLFLELDHGSFLRRAADVWYPKLPAKIKEFYEKP